MAVLTLLLLLAVTAADSQYVCYHSTSCGDGPPRPVFVLGETVEDCCRQPNVRSARRREIGASDNCSSCGPPSLERVTPRYTAVTPPGTLTLEVRATGYTAITWVFQNGTVMHDFPRVELEDSSKRFILNNVSEADFGRYEADLHTINGSVLTVEFFVDKYTTPMVSVNETGEGANVTLTCTAVGNPLPIVTWQYNNVTLPPSMTLTSSTPPPSTTVVLELHEERVGEEYTCVAINSHAGESSFVSESIIIRPNPPELIVVVPLGIEVNRTAPAAVELSCTAAGLPLPTIHWTRNNVLLVNGEGGVEVTVVTGTDMVVSQLRIGSSGYEDRGNYSCTAVNVAGEDSFTFQVLVRVLPNVTVWPEQQEVSIHDMGRRVTFVCQAFGIPTPQVTWVSDVGGLLNGHCEGPSLSEVFGEASLDYSDFPFTRDTGTDYGSSDPMDMGGEAPEDIVTPAPHNETTRPSEELRPSDCNVSLMRMDRESTTVSVLTISGAHMERSANFTCYARNDAGNGNGSVELLVTASPFFLSRPDPILQPIISRYLELNCTVVGQSPLDVIWTKDGIPLPFPQQGRVSVEMNAIGATTVTTVVRIVSVEEGDAGEYVCQAKDEDGTNSSSTTVNVRVPANITSPPVTTQADLHSNSSFTCQAQGQPLPSISWSKISGNDTILLDDFSTGTPMSNMSVVRVVQVRTDVPAGIITSQLVIENVQREDQGTYVCSTSNSVTLNNLTNIRSNATAELVVEVPPSFISVPRNTETVLSPNPVLFSCVARGLPQPVLRWFFAGVQLTNSSRTAISSSTILGNDVTTHSSLRLDRTELSDAGHYTCVAESSAGNVSFTFQLTVQTLPSVTITPPLVTRSPNGLATFECEGAGEPLPSLTWYRGNQELTCLCSDPTGCYGNYTYECSFDGDGPRLNCEFSCDSTSVTITIHDITISNMGQYTCQGNSTVGGPVNDTATLEVEVTPRVLVSRATPSNPIPEGETLSLTCEFEAYGLPIPDVTWLHDGNPVIPFRGTSRPRHTVVSVEVGEYLLRSVLNISDVVPGDEGEYLCRLDNLNEPVTDSIEVFIEARDDCFLGNGSTPCLNGGVCVDEVGGYTCNCTEDFMGQNCCCRVPNRTVPMIMMEPDNQEVSIFGPANFTCLATGEPPPTYSWFKDGELVAETLDPLYIIPEVRPSHRGRYTCIARNVLGSTNSSSPGLLTITGVLQYLATFTNCRDSASENFTELVTKMENRISGNTLETTQTVVYSVTPRRVRSGRSPEDQVVVTVVTNSSSRFRIVEDLARELQIITRELGCQFTSVVRFDGCQAETRNLSVEYNVQVPWRETEIIEVVTIDCPCGNLNATIHGGRTLIRECGGSYTYGAEWGNVTDNCAFSDITFQLCDITTLADISQQAGALAEATEDSSFFSSLDFTIATTIMTNLADSALATNQTEFQKNFTRSFNNLLDTETESLVESQEQSQAPSRLLETLSTFARQVMVGSEAVLFSEQRFQLQVEERLTLTFTNHTFSPDLSAQEEEFQKDTMETPLMDASITLPMDLVDQLRGEKLRVVNSALLTDSLFVVERDSMLGKRLANGTMVVGNVIISASVAGVERVVGLEEPVVIRFAQTKGLNETNMTEAQCVFWEQPNATETFGTWSSEGCRLVRVEEGEIVCECDHLTNFGLLLAINPLPPDMGLPLEIITYVALTSSIVCLLITIITYLITKKLRAHVFGQMLLHMCISLLGLYAFFLVAQQGAHYTTIPGFCFAVSAVLQYFMLVYFFWTAVEAVHLYLKLVKVFGSDVRHYILWASIVAWGVPFVIVAVCAGTGIYFDIVDGINLYAARDSSNNIFFCRSASWPFYFGIILPFGVVYIFNWTMFTIIMYSMCRRLCHRQKMPREKHTKEYKRLILIAACLSVMFGLGWVFGLLAAIPNPELSMVAQYIFATFIGTHGEFIFFFHCLRSNDVRKEWRRWFFAVCGCAKKPDHLVTTTPHGMPQLKGVGYLGSVGATDSEQRHNPLYESKDNLLSDTTGTSYISPYDMSSPHKEKVKDDSESLTKVQSLGSIEGLSYASQTVEIDFKTAENSDEEDGEPTVNLKDVTAIVNTNFQFPTEDGFAASDFMMPPLPTSAPYVASPSSPEAPLPMYTSASPDSPLPVHTVAETDSNMDILDTTAM